jgi:23S rRNA (guanine2445-N2)-methyltransferase / 23S rRNA (guanine2069-N7)-methyltransferase
MGYSIFVSCSKGLEYLLMHELEGLGLKNLKNSPHGVFGDADLSCVYQIALWSRLANRVHLILTKGSASHSKALYATCKKYPWHEVFNGDRSLKITFHGTSDELRNEMYSGQVVKDAIVDYFRDYTGERPDVDKRNAEVHFHAYLKHDQVTISLDLVGYSLHQRGYRLDQGMAPIKENIAAGMLLRMNWPEIAEKGGCFSDLVCGSGTIVIEAAMMAANMAPGLLRTDQAFSSWLGHKPQLWQALRQEAASKKKNLNIQLYGSDKSNRVLNSAKENIKRAQVEKWVTLQHLPLHQARKKHDHGLLVMNPPYGQRIGEQLDLIPLYKELGQTLNAEFLNWQAGVITSDPMLAKSIGLRAHKQYAISNGSLPCHLYCFNIDEHNRLKTGQDQSFSDGAQMFANRLTKNLQHLKKWATRQGIECYRIYDADLPEYAFAIDRYADYVVLQEYMPPKKIPEHVAANRRLDVLQVVSKVLNLSSEQLIVKQRRPQKEVQYQKHDNKKQWLPIQEGDARFYLNLHDYLDTGLFLDHRILRLEFSKLKPKTRFLNLFCYTATASVHAALAGASTVSVDMSKTYLAWAKENFKLNRLPLLRHKLVQSDVMTWIKTNQQKFDVIYMDAPSFSNSKRMEGTLDIQRDHVFLIQAALKSLTSQGKLYFSTHLRTFKLDPAVYDLARVSDMNRQTIDLDFKRNPKIHQCYLLEKH